MRRCNQIAAHVLTRNKTIQGQQPLKSDITPAIYIAEVHSFFQNAWPAARGWDAEEKQHGHSHRPPGRQQAPRRGHPDWHRAPPAAWCAQGRIRPPELAQWSAVRRKYRAEMAQPDAHHALAMLASLSATRPLSAGCYCEDDARCHRSVLRALLPEQGAHLADGVSALTARKARPGWGRDGGRYQSLSRVDRMSAVMRRSLNFQAPATFRNRSM